MASHREIRPMFASTDMVKQKHLLRHGLMSALMFVEDNAMAKMCIDRIRDSHGQGRLNIRPELYSHWISSIVQVVSEFDAQFTPALGQLWRDVLTPAVEHIKSGYHA
jgi:hemoglobin-like flavoprotein